MTARRLAFLLVVFSGGSPAVSAPPDTVKELQQHVRKLIDDTEPSVVALVISRSGAYDAVKPDKKALGILGDYTPKQNFGRFAIDVRDPLDLNDPRNAADHDFGSGVVIDPTGLVLTNYHLIENATKVFIRYSDNRGVYADIHAADSRSDLAVLRPRNLNGPFTPIKLGDVRTDDAPGKPATVFRGQWVVSLAHPFAAGFADGSPSASWGMMSNVRRRVPGFTTPSSDEGRAKHLYQFGNLLMTDARLNLGCSGGALLNLDGELIGLTTSTAAITGSEASGGFAIPMNASYRRIVATLRVGREVEYGFLGVTPGQMSFDPRRPGLRVNAVVANAPASLAGMEHFDVIQSVDGVPIREQDDLFLTVGAALAGTNVTIRVSAADGSVRDVKPRLVKLINTHPFIASTRPEAVHGLTVEYASVVLQKNIGGRGGLNNGFSHIGVCVRAVMPNSRADEKFKTLGDDPQRWMITKVNDTPVATPDEFYRAAGNNRGVIRLTVVNPANPSDRGRDLTLP